MKKSVLRIVVITALFTLILVACNMPGGGSSSAPTATPSLSNPYEQEAAAATNAANTVATVAADATKSAVSIALTAESAPSTTPAFTPTATFIPTLAPTNTPIVVNGDNLPSGKEPKFYFPYGKIIACTSINGPWVEAFANEQVYEIDPSSSVFPKGHFIMAEGVVVDSLPVDLHQNFELTAKVTMSQGNFWDCGPLAGLTKADKLVNLFDNNNGKFANWDSQKDKPFHPMLVITPYGNFPYEAGERPDWVRGLVSQATGAVGIYTCAYDEKELHEQDPAGVILSDNKFVGTAGSAGCDFVILKTGSDEATRYEGVIERFEYKKGTIFFVFNPKITNDEVQKMLDDDFDLEVTVTGP